MRKDVFVVVEYLSVLDGMTGKEIDRVDWPERNDRYGESDPTEP